MALSVYTVFHSEIATVSNVNPLARHMLSLHIVNSIYHFTLTETGRFRTQSIH